jgi:hypothetical protein
VSFQHLKLENLISNMMSQNKFYILSTPEKVFLWVGRNVPSLHRQGCLHILKTFLMNFNQVSF